MTTIKRLLLSIFVPALAALVLLSLACNPHGTAGTPFAGASSSETSSKGASTHPEFRGTSHDLTADEQSGGHTLRKHVGRSDDELRARLEQESISASSTYTDRSAAEYAVGNALQQGQNRIEQWLARSGSHPNLVLDYRGDQSIGRTLHRGDSGSQPCNDVKVVLRWLSSSEYYVLTSYPECR